jgi:hypothetical protein
VGGYRDKWRAMGVGAPNIRMGGLGCGELKGKRERNFIPSYFAFRLGRTLTFSIMRVGRYMVSDRDSASEMIRTGLGDPAALVIGIRMLTHHFLQNPVLLIPLSPYRSMHGMKSSHQRKEPGIGVGICCEAVGYCLRKECQLSNSRERCRC